MGWKFWTISGALDVLAIYWLAVVVVNGYGAWWRGGRWRWWIF